LTDQVSTRKLAAEAAMNDPVKGFGNIASTLARNPLGIIALFIVLVYGFASLVTAFGNRLSLMERLPLIYFMVIFPVLVLGVFTFLVMRYSSDLFAPSDFENQADYVELQRLKRDQLHQLDRDLTAEADTLIDAAVQHPGSISTQQIHSASKIEIQAKSLQEDVVETQLSQLSAEYQNLRKIMAPSRERTRAMTQVLVKMRTLGSAATHLLDRLKQSDAAGDRLAAVAIMQIDPGRADIEWLAGRYDCEKPFIFYQASTALSNIARAEDRERAAAALAAARRGLAVIKQSQRPDINSIQVLETLISEHSGA
jgi:hypothetical protein